MRTLLPFRDVLKPLNTAVELYSKEWKDLFSLLVAVLQSTTERISKQKWVKSIHVQIKKTLTINLSTDRLVRREYSGEIDIRTSS